VHLRHCSGLPVQGLVEGTGRVKHCEKEGGERRNSFQTYHHNLLWFMVCTWEVSQLEMSPLKALASLNTVKKVREETVFKHITTTYCKTCPSLLRSASSGVGWRHWHMKTLCRKEGGERRNSFQTYHYNLLYCMFVTAPVCQFRGWLKALAPANTGKGWWEKKQFSNITTTTYC